MWHAAKMNRGDEIQGLGLEWVRDWRLYAALWFKSFYGVTFEAFVTTDLPHLREMPNFPRKDGGFVTRRRLGFFVKIAMKG